MHRKLSGPQMNRVAPEEYPLLPESGLVVVLDNVRSAHNVGSAFRSADAFKVDRIYLCGISAAPPSAEIHKTALGAEESVPWEHCTDTLEAVKRLREEGYVIASVEQAENSVSLEKFHDTVCADGQRYALIFGNELSGVAQEVVDQSDCCIEIPQFGSKHSLNVSVAVGVVLWEFARNFDKKFRK